MHLLILNHTINVKIWDIVLLGIDHRCLGIRNSELEEILENILFCILTEENPMCAGHPDNNGGRI